MATVQERARRQQRIEELCAAAIRALAANPELHYRGNRLFHGQQRIPVNAAHLRLDPEVDDFASFRGMMDAVSLRLRHSCPELHRRLCPDDAVERLLFELLEQFRVEALVSGAMPGMASNMRRRFQVWSDAFHGSGLTETSLGILLFTVAQVCWSRLTANGLPEPTQDLLETTRGALAPVLGKDLAGLRRHRREQAAFAEHALAIARRVADMIRGAVADEAEDNDAEDVATLKSFALLLDFETGEDVQFATAASGRSKTLDAAAGYQVFTRQYDRQVDAATLVRKELLQENRLRLDQWVGRQGVNFRRLVRQLVAALAVLEQDGWSFGEEEGHIDGRRLPQLISSPSERRLFRLDRRQLRADCVVGLLVDCSGSMKEHAMAVAGMLDILVRALDQARVTTEVLGFTTGAWGGGRPRSDWFKQGRPAHPGRLNETLRLVFKEGDRSWRRARPDLAALLKLDLYREGVDGEAVEWACGRLLARGERRRILIVISDGCPADSATALSNDDHYLGNHLREVIARHAVRQDVEILGIGVGLDLSPYYPRCLATDLGQGLDNQLFTEIVQLIAGGHRR